MKGNRWIATAIFMCLLMSSCGNSQQPASSSEPEVIFKEGELQAPPATSSTTPKESIDDLKGGKTSEGLPEYVKPGQWSFDMSESSSQLEDSESSEEPEAIDDEDIDGDTDTDTESTPSDLDLTPVETYGFEQQESGDFLLTSMEMNSGNFFGFPVHRDYTLEEPYEENKEVHLLFSGHAVKGDVYFRNPETFGPGVTLKYLVETMSNQFKLKESSESSPMSTTGIINTTGGISANVFYVSLPDICNVTVIFGKDCGNKDWLCGTLSIDTTAGDESGIAAYTLTLNQLGMPEIADKVNSIVSSLALTDGILSDNS